MKILLFCITVISVCSLNLLQIHGNIDFHGKRTKRENYHLNIMGIRQPYVYDCASTAVQCILQYFGLSTNIIGLRNEIQSHVHTRSFNWGEPRGPEGLNLENVLRVLNDYITTRNLNNNRQYRLTHILFGMSIDGMIRESLRENMPLIIATSGHVVVINGIEGNTIQYMDPADGGFHTVPYEEMRRNLRGDSYLIHYNSGQPIQPDIVEMTAMCLGTSMPIADFPSCFSDVKFSKYIRKKRSSMMLHLLTATNKKNIAKRSSDTRDAVFDRRDNNDSLEPNWDNLYYEPQKDAFVVTCKSGTDQITLTISLRTALGLARVYLTRTPSDFKHYATAFCWQMRQKDETCWGGNIETRDHQAMVDVLYHNFDSLKEKIVTMMKTGPNKAIRITTNRNKSENEFQLKNEF